MRDFALILPRKQEVYPVCSGKRSRSIHKKSHRSFEAVAMSVFIGVTLSPYANPRSPEVLERHLVWPSRWYWTTDPVMLPGPLADLRNLPV